MQEITVPTALGDITVKSYGTFDEYPGITVFINGEQVVTVEHDTGRDVLQANVWLEDYYNDPEYHIEYPDLAR